MSERVCAVVVTHNRFALLKEALNSLRNQTTPLSKIVVIDNGSNDGTSEWLNDQKDIYTINQENLGGAGGFYTGVKWAYENGFEWIWLLDDDIELMSNCLEVLLKFSGSSKCLHPRKKYLDDKYMHFESYMDFRTGSVMHLEDKSFEYGKDICFINVGNFEGMLVHKTIVSQIGFPDYRLFITKDDQIYGFKASMYTNVSLVRDAIIIRKKNSGVEELSDFTLYYFLRNMHFLNDVLGIYYPKKQYIMTRKVYSYLNFFKFFLLTLFSRRNISFKLKRLNVIFKALVAFVLKKEGKTF